MEEMVKCCPRCLRLQETSLHAFINFGIRAIAQFSSHKTYATARITSFGIDDSGRFVNIWSREELFLECILFRFVFDCILLEFVSWSRKEHCLLVVAVAGHSLVTQ